MSKKSIGKDNSFNEVSQSRRSSQGIVLSQGSGSGPLAAVAAGGSDPHVDSTKKKGKSPRKNSLPGKTSSKKLKGKKTQTRSSVSKHSDQERKKSSTSDATNQRNSTEINKRISFSNDTEGGPEASRKRSSIKEPDETRRQISIAPQALNHHSSILKRTSEERAEGLALKRHSQRHAGEQNSPTFIEKRKSSLRNSSKDLGTETLLPLVENKGTLATTEYKDMCVCSNDCVCVDDDATAAGERPAGNETDMCLCPDECLCVDEDREFDEKRLSGSRKSMERPVTGSQLILGSEQATVEKDKEAMPAEQQAKGESGDLTVKTVSSQIVTTEDGNKRLSEGLSGDKFPRSPENPSYPENSPSKQEIPETSNFLPSPDDIRKSGDYENRKLSLESPLAPHPSYVSPDYASKETSFPTMDRKSFEQSEENATDQTGQRKSLDKSDDNSGGQRKSVDKSADNPTGQTAQKTEEQENGEPEMFDTSTCENLDFSAGRCCDAENMMKVLQSALPPNCKLGEMIILDNTPTIDLEQEVDRLVAVAKHHCNKEKNIIRRRYEEEIKNMKNQHEEELKRMKKKMEEDLESLKAKFEDEMKAMEAKLGAEQKGKGDSQQKLAEYEEEIKRLNQALEERPTKEAMESLEKKIQELEELLAAAKRLEEENHELKHELEKLMKILDEHGLLKDQMMEHEGEIARLQQMLKNMELEHESHLDMAQSEILNKCEEEKAKLLSRIKELEGVEEENTHLKEEIQKQKDLLAHAQTEAEELEADLRKQMETMSEECKNRKNPIDEYIDETKRFSTKPSVVNFKTTETTTKKSFTAARQSELPEYLTRAGGPSTTASFASIRQSHGPHAYQEFMNEEIITRQSTHSLAETMDFIPAYEERPKVKDEAVNCIRDFDPCPRLNYQHYQLPQEPTLTPFFPCPPQPPCPPKNVCYETCNDMLRQRCNPRTVLAAEAEKENVRCIGQELLVMGRRILEEIDLAESFRQPCIKPDKYGESHERPTESNRSGRKSDEMGNHAKYARNKSK